MVLSLRCRVPSWATCGTLALALVALLPAHVAAQDTPVSSPPPPTLLSEVESETGLSKGAIVGICIGSVAGAVFLVVGCCMLLRARRAACWSVDVEKALTGGPAPDHLVPSKHRAADMDPLDQNEMEMSKVGQYTSPGLVPDPDTDHPSGPHASAEGWAVAPVALGAVAATGSGKASGDKGLSKTSMLLKWLDGIEGDGEARVNGDRALLGPGAASSTPGLGAPGQDAASAAAGGAAAAKGVGGAPVAASAGKGLSGKFGSSLMQQLWTGAGGDKAGGAKGRTAVATGMAFHRLPPSTTASPAPSVAGSSRILLAHYKYRSDEVDGYHDGPNSSDQLAMPPGNLGVASGFGGAGEAAQGVGMGTPRDRAELGRVGSVTRGSMSRAGGISFARISAGSSASGAHLLPSSSMPHHSHLTHHHNQLFSYSSLPKSGNSAPQYALAPSRLSSQDPAPSATQAALGGLPAQLPSAAPLAAAAAALPPLPPSARTPRAPSQRQQSTPRGVDAGAPAVGFAGGVGAGPDARSSHDLTTSGDVITRITSDPSSSPAADTVLTLSQGGIPLKSSAAASLQHGSQSLGFFSVPEPLMPPSAEQAGQVRLSLGLGSPKHGVQGAKAGAAEAAQ